MKYAYVTVLSTNHYFLGALTMFETLKMTNPKVQEFVVLVNEEIDEEKINILNRIGYKVIKIDKVNIESNIDYNWDHWKNTFDKLKIFELTDYDKIVYLDSDLQILKNIDELFNYPHLSGTIAGKAMHPDWTGINSGLMVIEPKEGELGRILEGIKNWNREEEFGDQDIINYYYHWTENSKELREEYNIFSGYVDFYVKECHYNPLDFYTIHYVGPDKPWMIKKEDRERQLEEYRAKGLDQQAYYLEEYFKVLENIKME